MTLLLLLALAQEEIRLLVRSDDMGAAQSINEGCVKSVLDGIARSVEVIVPGPWYPQAVRLLKEHPEIEVGLHLCLTSEWEDLKWGPLTHAPSLVDVDGHFFPTTRQRKEFPPNTSFLEAGPKPEEVERELRAQIERALRSGLRIDYVDYHMGTPLSTPEFRDVTERLAREFNLGMSGYFGEASHDPQYWAQPQHKTDSLVAMVARLRPGLNVVVTHVGIDDAELGALVDMNTSNPLPDMSKNRQGELDALTSPRFGEALRARNVQLVTYRQLIDRQGLKSMRRPGG